MAGYFRLLVLVLFIFACQQTVAQMALTSSPADLVQAADALDKISRFLHPSEMADKASARFRLRVVPPEAGKDYYLTRVLPDDSVNFRTPVIDPVTENGWLYDVEVLNKFRAGHEENRHSAAE